MLALSEQGDNETVDMLVGDIYGSDYSKLGLKSTMIASTFGKVFKKQGGKKRIFKAEDISKSLLYAISNNIGQIAYVMFCSYSVGTRILFVRRSHARTNLGTRLPAGSKLTSSIISRYMNAEKYNLDRIYFGGYFIRGASSRPCPVCVPAPQTFALECSTSSPPRVLTPGRRQLRFDYEFGVAGDPGWAGCAGHHIRTLTDWLLVSR